MTRVEAPRYTPMAEIGLDDFHAGNWRPHIEALLAKRMPAVMMRSDGAQVCAARICELGK